jgi:putative toxin-antitoxin system antitoxin component (TIGR02293 family)
MKLPDYLEADDAGFTHLAGHRIGLHNVVRMYADGSSPEMIAAHYPSLPLALIHRVIAFYLDNQFDVDAYVSAHEQEIERQIATASASSPMITRVLRKAVELFEGDRAGAMKWLQMPQPALEGLKPLDVAKLAGGAGQVEDLIGRLEHGVFT